MVENRVLKGANHSSHPMKSDRPEAREKSSGSWTIRKRKQVLFTVCHERNTATKMMSRASFFYFN